MRTHAPERRLWRREETRGGQCESMLILHHLHLHLQWGEDEQITAVTASLASFLFSSSTSSWWPLSLSLSLYFPWRTERSRLVIKYTKQSHLISRFAFIGITNKHVGRFNLGLMEPLHPLQRIRLSVCVCVCQQHREWYWHNPPSSFVWKVSLWWGAVDSVWSTGATGGVGSGSDWYSLV